jgi:hypothetical protein
LATSHQVSCINKSDRFNAWERIKSIGGLNADNTRWRLSQEEAIRGIKDGTWSFYVRRQGNTVRVLVAVSRFGNEYLKTEADGEAPDNLLSLPECPA